MIGGWLKIFIKSIFLPKFIDEVMLVLKAKGYNSYFKITKEYEENV